MFSSTAIHSAPISLNILTNTVLKNNSQEKSITAINHPLHSIEVSVLEDSLVLNTQVDTSSFKSDV